MGKMNELSQLLDELIACGEMLTKTALSLKEFYSGTTEPTAAPAKTEASAPAKGPAAAEPEVKYTKEQVRALLAEKSNEEHGKYKAQVKAIVKKYGNGGSLTNVDEKDYAALMQEAKAIGNG